MNLVRQRGATSASALPVALHGIHGGAALREGGGNGKLYVVTSRGDLVLKRTTLRAWAAWKNRATP